MITKGIAVSVTGVMTLLFYVLFVIMPDTALAHLLYFLALWRVLFNTLTKVHLS